MYVRTSLAELMYIIIYVTVHILEFMSISNTEPYTRIAINILKSVTSITSAYVTPNCIDTCLIASIDFIALIYV